MKNDTVTLTGYLGRDPRFLLTQTRTLERKRVVSHAFKTKIDNRYTEDKFDVVSETFLEELQTTPRTYAVLSLAVHQGRETHWHRIVAWDSDRFFGLGRLGKGDQVEVTGRPTMWTAPDGTEVEQIELVGFRLKRRKIRTSESRPTLNRIKPTAAAAATPHGVFINADGDAVPLAGPIVVRRRAA